MNQSRSRVLFGFLTLALAVECSLAVITVQIGGATRLSSLSRQRDRYSCYWDCDLVGCQIARDDDECAYDCEKICRVKYDYAARSGAADTSGADSLAPKSNLEQLLNGKSSAAPAESGPVAGAEQAPELVGGKYGRGPKNSSLNLNRKWLF